MYVGFENHEGIQEIQHWSKTHQVTMISEIQADTSEKHDISSIFCSETGNISESDVVLNVTCSENSIFKATGPPDILNASLIFPSLVNITRIVPLRYALPLFGYVMPFLLIITIIANTLIVIVLSQRHMKTPTNLVLLSMAISDLLTLLFPSPWYFYMYTLGNHSKVLYPPSACYAYYCMIETLPAFFHTASIWLTLVLACQRYIYVCHPVAASTWCTVPRVLKSICWVYILALLHQLSRFFDRTFLSVSITWHDKTILACQQLTAEWVKSTVTEDVYYISYYGFRIIFIHVGPCVSLVVFNAFLFDAIKKARKKREKLFREKKQQNSFAKKSVRRDGNNTTLMLVVVVTVFLAVEIPLAVTTLLHVMQSALNLFIVDYTYLNTTILFTNFLIMLTYPLNFAIYCGMSRQFRKTFKDLFMKGNVAPSPRNPLTLFGSNKYSVVDVSRTCVNDTVF